MRKRTLFYDFTIYEFRNWLDIHKASKWPIVLSYNNHRRPIFRINAPLDIKQVSHRQKSGLKQYMIKKPATGSTHRWFAYALYHSKPSEVEIHNDIFRKW